MTFDINRPWMTLDPWQLDYINSTDTNCFLLCARQVGKSAACSIKMGKIACEKPSSKILMIAYTENQAYLLFFKTLQYIQAVHPDMICKGAKKPTKHQIHLKNNSVIMCYAAGNAGDSVRGMTLTNLVIDEAASMAREVADSTFPMISVTGGKIDLLSTPKGEIGFFYECSKRADFKKFYVSAEDCPRHSKEFLELQKQTMSKNSYMQEYCAVFISDLRRLFDEETIKQCCRLKRPGFINPGIYYIGVDIAHRGEDLSVFSVIQKLEKDKYRQVESIATRHTRLTETYDKILELNRLYKPIYIYIDDGGCGSGVMDFCLQNSEVKRKVVALNNSARPLNRDETQNKKILKEDLYSFMLACLEHHKLLLLDDEDIKLSLASVQYEYVVKEGHSSHFRIFGQWTHHAESLVRAAHGLRDRRLGIWVR